MARIKKTKQKETSKLVQALNFISNAQKEKGTPLQIHCRIQNNTITAFDGILSAGCLIDEDLNANPQTYKLLSALTKCGQSLNLTQLDNSKLSVKSGKFNAFVECAVDEMPFAYPDEQIAAIDDSLKEGLGLISHLTKKDAQRVILSTVLLKSGSMLTTDSYVILEYWHGFNLPTCVLPTSFVQAILNIEKKLVGFGYNEVNGIPNSCTFWYEDNSWLKTQLYAEQWPNTDKILNVTTDPQTLTKGFFEALNYIEDFSPNGTVHFFNECIAATSNKFGATYQIKGLPENKTFNIKQLRRIEKIIETIDFQQDRAYFFGKKIRGCIMEVRT